MKTKLLILVLALQSAWMLGTAALQERILRQGQIILLETQPVDPRDLLRGDYVRLNYAISDVPHELFPAPPAGELPAGQTIFVAVALAATNQFYHVTRASTEKFSPAAGEVILRGVVIGQSWRTQVQSGSVHVEYGLEQYFVAEGTGNPRGKLTVQAAVDKSGTARIKEVFVDGQPYVKAMKPAAR